MTVITRGHALLALDQQQLAVHLEAGYAKNYVDAVIRETLRPADIGSLVKAGRQFHHCGHPLAVVHRVYQGIDDPGIPGHPIQADLDLRHLRVQRCRL